ncbi:hypothetical protein HUO13_05485 [Saccharopolyspora erythraea]|uniref:hypothetical protein n=1 Tax=Saccharopolyspora erythraea TaxID=1836 RepID=UPI001BAAD07C|nr:hypothetical protein [Saccharopolyspora erythraea]QUH00344.1 hypothetical protein HUO13_05485 [Saccharopolyspora erythraea]
MNDTRVINQISGPRMEVKYRMLMPEDLSKIRMQDLIHEAREARLAREVGAGRLWRRLAAYASDRADRAQRCR